MSPTEWRDLPDWEQDALLDGFRKEFPPEDGAGGSGSSGRGDLSKVPPELQRLL